jgi:hypothetical protein
MPNSDFIPDADGQFLLWYDQFLTACIENSEELGLTTTDLDKIQSFSDDFKQKLTRVVSTKSTYEGAVKGKKLSRTLATKNIRGYANRFKADLEVSPGTLRKLGVVSISSSAPVVPVSKLGVVGIETGINKLSWKRNGNSSQTMFIVEFRVAGEEKWEFAGAVSKTNFIHDGQIPGQRVWYRVTSTRASKSSVPCPAVAAYGPLESNDLSVAA